jgi:uncharacterized cupin superfamily protein
MSDANIYTDKADFEHEGVLDAAVGHRAGAELLGASVYELAPGARWGRLHIHYANEEMIVVISGRPTLYTLEGRRELAPGEVVACLRGPQGAHRLENHSDAPTRVLIVSTMLMPEIVEYPEHGEAFAMTEPPYTDAPYDPKRGRLLRGFKKSDARPVPPDSD